MSCARVVDHYVPRKRYGIELPVCIELLGSLNMFELQTINVSPGGMFISFSEDHIPFYENTLLEVKISLGQGEDSLHINFVGKYVHHKAGVGIGIKIVQIEPEHENLWVDFLEEFGKQNPKNII